MGQETKFVTSDICTKISEIKLQMVQNGKIPTIHLSLYLVRNSLYIQTEVIYIYDSPIDNGDIKSISK